MNTPNDIAIEVADQSKTHIRRQSLEDPSVIELLISVLLLSAIAGVIVGALLAWAAR